MNHVPSCLIKRNQMCSLIWLLVGVNVFVGVVSRYLLAGLNSIIFSVSVDVDYLDSAQRAVEVPVQVPPLRMPLPPPPLLFSEEGRLPAPPGPRPPPSCSRGRGGGCGCC